MTRKLISIGGMFCSIHILARSQNTFNLPLFVPGSDYRTHKEFRVQESKEAKYAWILLHDTRKISCGRLPETLFTGSSCLTHAGYYSVSELHSYFFMRMLKNLAKPEDVLISSHTFS